MKQILIAFVAATVLLALEDALARQCRNLLWSGILPLAALLCFVTGFTGESPENANEHPAVPQDEEDKE